MEEKVQNEKKSLDSPWFDGQEAGEKVLSYRQGGL